MARRHDAGDPPSIVIALVMAPAVGGILVKRCLVKMSLISSCALMATHAFAQSSAQPRSAAKTTTAASKAPTDAPKTQTAAASAKTAKPTLSVAITAAGSVILLADGIVANATLAQIQPPADGFVYER